MFAIYNQGFIQRLQRSRDRVVAAGASEKMEAFLAGFGARLYRNKTLPFPLLMKKSDFDDLSCATHNVLSAQQKIARHICEKYGKSQLISLLRLPSGLAQFINWENMFEGNTRIGRMDVVPTAQGYYFCEINTHSAVGGAEYLSRSLTRLSTWMRPPRAGIVRSTRPGWPVPPGFPFWFPLRLPLTGRAGVRSGADAGESDASVGDACAPRLRPLLEGDGVAFGVAALDDFDAVAGVEDLFKGNAAL